MNITKVDQHPLKKANKPRHVSYELPAIIYISWLLPILEALLEIMTAAWTSVSQFLDQAVMVYSNWLPCLHSAFPGQ
jgi:hypothetical protein